MKAKTKKALRSLMDKGAEKEVLVVFKAIKTGELQVECVIQALEEKSEELRQAKPGTLHSVYPNLLK
jgi:hypothetical protein